MTKEKKNSKICSRDTYSEESKQLFLKFARRELCDNRLWCFPEGIDVCLVLLAEVYVSVLTMDEDYRKKWNNIKIRDSMLVKFCSKVLEQICIELDRHEMAIKESLTED